MSDDSIDSIVATLERLELQQEEELEQLKRKHKKAKRKVLRRLTTSPKALKVPADLCEPRVLSFSKRRLHRGDRVRIRTTATIGCKGDIAIVLYVSAPRIDISIPRLNDTSWRAPHNLEHIE